MRGGEFCNFAASNQYNLCYEKIFTFDGCYLCSYFYGVRKDEQESFKFDIENLYGTWQGIAIQSNGEWIDITQPPHTNLAFSVVFYENGTYSGSGYFGNGSGTYKAEGDMIYTYIDGEELYRYKVHSISNGIAEVSMGVAGDNITLEIKLQKSNQIGYMFQNKGENKSRLCYSLQNHYICIAKSKCDTNISNHIGYFVSII